MNYARDYLLDIYPVNLESYRNLSEDQISHSDQLIYRFSQLQDTIGNKLFPLILQGIGEYEQNMPFIDRLNRLEKLSIIEDSVRWLNLREIRNLVTHEYPDNENEVIDGLNELYHQSGYLSSTLDKLLDYIEKRKWL